VVDRSASDGVSGRCSRRSQEPRRRCRIVLPGTVGRLSMTVRAGLSCGHPVVKINISCSASCQVLLAQQFRAIQRCAPGRTTKGWERAWWAGHRRQASGRNDATAVVNPAVAGKPESRARWSTSATIRNPVTRVVRYFMPEVAGRCSSAASEVRGRSVCRWSLAASDR
jgi:hypothetical protein